MFLTPRFLKTRGPDTRCPRFAVVAQAPDGRTGTDGGPDIVPAVGCSALTRAMKSWLLGRNAGDTRPINRERLGYYFGRSLKSRTKEVAAFALTTPCCLFINDPDSNIVAVPDGHVQLGAYLPNLVGTSQ